jgi:hypothetical protein
MRKTSDLINEMLDESKGAWVVAIAVGFENETKFVFSSEPRPLNALNNLIKDGGYPIGLIRFDKEGEGLQGSYRPFEEYADDPWAKEYLAGLLKNAGEIVALSRRDQTFPTAY